LRLDGAGRGRWRIVGGVDVSDYLDLIAAPGREEEVWEALLQHRAAERAVWHLRGLRAESPTATRLPGLAPAHGLTCVVEREDRCPLLRLFLRRGAGRGAACGDGGAP